MSNRSFLRRHLSVLAVAPLALGLVACGDDDDNDDLASPSSTVTVTEDADGGSASPSTSPSQDTGGGAPADGALAAAAETALGEVSGATLVSIDVDDNGDWDVTLVSDDGTESEVDVSADGSTVTRGPVTENDDDGDDVAERQRLLEASVDYTAAIETAAGEIPDLTVTGASLDEDNGTLVWDVDFGDGTNDDAQTVLVDAGSGQVVGTQTDDDNDD